MFDLPILHESRPCGMLTLGVWLVSLTLLSPLTARAAEEFRIETEVFVGEEEKPVSKSVTIFEKDAVYDISIEPPELVIYRDPAPDRPGMFILFDARKQQRTEVETGQIQSYHEKLVEWAAAQTEPMMRFSAEPEFSEGFSTDGTQLSLDSPAWTYRVRTIPATTEGSLKRFRDFTDWYAKLNAMRYSTPPPGARLALNAAFVKHGVVPVEINRLIEADETGVRAVHVFSWRLSREDQTRLDEARRQLAAFEKVDAQTFLKKE